MKSNRAFDIVSYRRHSFIVLEINGMNNSVLSCFPDYFKSLYIVKL